MKVSQTARYRALDGLLFDTEAECLEYEETSLKQWFVGLTIEQVIAAFDRSNTNLADAFEIAGARIGVARRKSGEVRRRGGRHHQDKSANPEDRQEQPDEHMED